MKRALFAVIAMIVLLAQGCQRTPKEVERPERILSKRQIVYDSSSYAKLAVLWEKYYDVYPSEDAYANWMYAARYAELPDYESILKKGLEKYPSNPVLLYLTALTKHWGRDNLEGLQLLERASELDPDYMDAWYGLTIMYLAHGDREKADAALRRLLDGRAVEDEVMDFSYNMIASLDSNAILITNGDNDTYPGWILTRIIHFRPDVKIVNRSLLNTDWYPAQIVREGVPTFVSQAVLDSMEKQVATEMARARSNRVPPEGVPLLGDRLVVRVIGAAEAVGYPVYFACTLESVEVLKEFGAHGRQLGLVTLVTPSGRQYGDEVRKLLATWVTEYRTAGLDSWHLRSAKESRAGRMLVRNYAEALFCLKDQIQAGGSPTQLETFRWYRRHLIEVIPKDLAEKVNGVWCRPGSPPEIQLWCREQGMTK